MDNVSLPAYTEISAGDASCSIDALATLVIRFKDRSAISIPYLQRLGFPSEWLYSSIPQETSAHPKALPIIKYLHFDVPRRPRILDPIKTVEQSHIPSRYGAIGRTFYEMERPFLVLERVRVHLHRAFLHIYERRLANCTKMFPRQHRVFLQNSISARGVCLEWCTLFITCPLPPAFDTLITVEQNIPQLFNSSRQSLSTDHSMLHDTAIAEISLQDILHGLEARGCIWTAAAQSKRNNVVRIGDSQNLTFIVQGAFPKVSYVMFGEDVERFNILTLPLILKPFLMRCQTARAVPLSNDIRATDGKGPFVTALSSHPDSSNVDLCDRLEGCKVRVVREPFSNGTGVEEG